MNISWRFSQKDMRMGKCLVAHYSTVTCTGIIKIHILKDKVEPSQKSIASPIYASLSKQLI